MFFTKECDAREVPICNFNTNLGNLKSLIPLKYMNTSLHNMS